MKTLSGKTLEEIAIERLKTFEPSEGYYVAYSGGKDSDVILDLVRRSGCKYDAHHALTTADPPEVVRHVKEHSDVTIHRPKKTMWELIAHKKQPPLRQTRYCCQTQKEFGGEGRLVVTGVRWNESTNRSKRKMVEHCYRHSGKRYLHVIIDWTTTDIWNYINYNINEHLQRWPKICRAWERAIKKTYNYAVSKHPNCWSNPEEYWQWWLSRDSSTKKGDNEMYLW